MNLGTKISKLRLATTKTRACFSIFCADACGCRNFLRGQITSCWALRSVKFGQIFDF
jgi:hypothetical protein